MSPEADATTGAESHPQQRRKGLPRLSSRQRLGAWIFLFSLAIVGLCCLTYSPFLVERFSRLPSSNKYLALADGLLNPFRSRHALFNSGLPVYDLKIRPEQWSILLQVAEKAKEAGWLNDDLKVWSKATLYHDGKSYDVKIRIRGDLRPHWIGPKKSYRIRFGKEKITDSQGTREEAIYFQGKREINLIIPADKLYALAPFVNALMRDAGLLVPRDRWVILRVNGVLHGLYYEVEHFDKPLLAAARRPETTVFGQNTRAMHYEHLTKLGRPGPTDAGYDMGSLRRQVDPEGDLGLRAMQVLVDHSLNPTPENFRRVRAVLDWEKYLRYRAITTICNTSHTRWGTDNLKLYFDTSLGLIEPIPWDVRLDKMPREPGTIDFYNNHGTDEIQRATLLDPRLRLKRNQFIWQLVGDGGDSLMAKYNAMHNKIRTLVWADVLQAPVQGYKMDEVRSILEHNIRRIYKVLEYSAANVTYQLRAPNQATVDIACLNYSGIRLTGIELSDSLYVVGVYFLYEDADDDGQRGPKDPLIARTIASSGTARFQFDRYLFPKVRYDSDFINGAYWEFFDALMGRQRFFITGQLAPANRGPLDFRAPRLSVAAINAVSERPIPQGVIDPREPTTDNSIGVLAFDASDPWDLEAPDASLSEFLVRHREFRANGARPGAAEISGTVTISGTIIIPKSVPLVLQPGANITLRPAASVLCMGGLSAIGTREKPIRIHGDGSGKPWNTFAVARPPEKVVVIHTIFQDGGQAQINGILFTGGFAVHDGDLELRNCQFTDMQSEDAVNLKNGRILMSECTIRRTASDAVDLDFVTGEVRSNYLVDIAGDAIDLSGSTLLVAGNRCESIGDKGISVGEDSHPSLVNNLFIACTIGASFKDLSFAKVEHCTFVGNKTAIEAKRKKPMFGGGSGELDLCVFARNDILLEEDHFSRGKVSIKRSIIDTETGWPTCKTLAIRFMAPEAGDYRLAPGMLQDSRIEAGPVGRSTGVSGPEAGFGSGVTPGILNDAPHAVPPVARSHLRADAGR